MLQTQQNVQQQAFSLKGDGGVNDLNMDFLQVGMQVHSAKRAGDGPPLSQNGNTPDENLQLMKSIK